MKMLQICLQNYSSRFDNEEKDFALERDEQEKDGVTDVKITASVPRGEIADEIPVTCEVSIPNSDYTKKETIVYDGMKSFPIISDDSSSRSVSFYALMRNLICQHCHFRLAVSDFLLTLC